MTVQPAPQPTEHRRVCPLCEACCGLLVQVQGTQVLKVRGDPDDVLSRGYLCPKGVALKDLHHDPDRLRQPLVKRNGRHVAVGWDEAWAEIEARLPAVRQAHGERSVAVMAGNPSSHKMGTMLYLGRLLKALGRPQVYSASTLDQMPRHLSSGLLFGHWMSVPVPDIDRSQWLLVLGANPAVSNGSMWTVPDFKGRASAVRARGGRLVVVDPRRTETADLADEHHFIRPGTDVYFLLGLVNAVLSHPQRVMGRLQPWVSGVEAFAAAVAPHTPERMAPLCGVGEEAIRRLAHGLVTTPQASVYARIGTCTQVHGSLNTWLVDALNLLTGHLDEPGGAMFPMAAAFAANTQHLGTPQEGRGRGVPWGRHHSRVSASAEVMGEWPIGCLLEELETPGEGQVKALITVATNPVLSSPEGHRLERALKGLPFMLSLDIYLNETTRHADLILPAPSPLEDEHYDVPYPQLSCRNQARYSAAVWPRAPGQPAEWETLTRLAAVVGGDGPSSPQVVDALDRQWFEQEVRQRFGAQAEAVVQATTGWRGPERWLELALRTGPYGDRFGQRPEGLTLDKVKAASAHGGLDLGPLQPRLPAMLLTPSGTIELAPPLFMEALARLDTPAASPAWVLIGRRDSRSNNSWMHNLPVLAKGPMRCTAQMHPHSAQALGLREGDRVQLEADHGECIELPVEFSERLMPGVVSVPHGWGHEGPDLGWTVAAQRPGANINRLMDHRARDPLSGTAVLSGQAVRVGRAQVMSATDFT